MKGFKEIIENDIINLIHLLRISEEVAQLTTP